MEIRNGNPNDITTNVDAHPGETASNPDQSTSTRTAPEVRYGHLGIGQEGQGRSATKTDIVLKKRQSAKGITIQALMDATGWQVQSVRGFLSGGRSACRRR
ncbi:MAG: DUF3489 domain-containing protein [Mesorhizobium sp.]|nr:MAG: DUF3489 domain-containing protein [Mesorhizobium sp.]